MKNILIICFMLICGITNGQSFTLSSPDLTGQFSDQFIASNFGCSGNNSSPELRWVNAPKETKSFAVTMFDPDAPTGSGFWHWVVVNVPATSNGLKKGAGSVLGDKLPYGAIQSLNDAGTIGYQGPCPPVGDKPHAYVITVYALNADKLGTDTKSSGALIGFMLHSATIAKASIIVYSKR